MRRIIPIIVLTVISISCGGRKSTTPEKQSTTKTYENEYFTIKYPSDWTTFEEINDMCDTIPAMSKGIAINIENPNVFPMWQSVRVQKSAMFEVFDSPKGWRDLSVELKQFDDHYLGTIDAYMIDSLKFGPYPAAMAGFVIATDRGDTIVQKQLVIMNGKELYYLDNQFDWNDDGTMEKVGDSILCTTRFINPQISDSMR